MPAVCLRYLILLSAALCCSISAGALAERGRVQDRRRAAPPAGPYIDLHSHFAGQLSSDQLLETVGPAAGPIKPNPHDFCPQDESIFQPGPKKLGFLTPQTRLVGAEGKKVELRYGIPWLRDLGLSAKAARQIEDSIFLLEARTPLNLPGLDHPVLRGGKELDVIYAHRRHLAQNTQLLPQIIGAIAAESRQQGVCYLELSIGKKLADPALLPVIRSAIQAAEQATGVRIRFLRAYTRSYDPALNEKVFAEERAAGLFDPGSPFVGIDVVGNETNSILTQKRLLRAAASWRAGGNPLFQVRVHAGERMRTSSRELRDVIRLGVTSIAHAVYGLDEETMRLLAERRVTVLVSDTSNRALWGVPRDRGPQLRRMLRAGVPVMFSSDGAGIFGSDAARETWLVRARYGLTRREVQQVLDTNARYLRDVAGIEPRDFPHYQPSKAQLKEFRGLRSKYRTMEKVLVRSTVAEHETSQQRRTASARQKEVRVQMLQAAATTFGNKAPRSRAARSRSSLLRRGTLP